MKSSKLIRILGTFSSKEFKKFEKLAISHFYKLENNIAFVNFLANNYPKYTKENITKEKVFAFVYGNKTKYNDIRVREFMSDTFIFLKDYIVNVEINSSDFYYELNLLKQYNKRKLDVLYLSQLKVLKKIIKKDKYKNKEYHKRMYFLADVENDYFNNKRIRAIDDNLQIKIDNLDLYYFSAKLIDSCLMMNRQTILNHKFKFNLLKEINEIIENNKNKYLNQATIICYLEIFKLLQKTDNEIQYFKTLKILKNHISHFTNNEQKALFEFLKNYCIRNINNGNERYVEILFDLLQFLIDKEFNKSNGFIFSNDYNNIIATSLKLKKYEWSEKFIDNYKSKVDPNQRENAYNMNKAYLYYATKNYEKTLDFLNLILFTDVHYAYYAKTLQLKTYFALEEFETLSYFITSFKTYIQRNNEIPTSFKKDAILFLSYFKKIFTIADKKGFGEKAKTTEKLNSLSKDISKEKKIHNKIWLLEIVEELKK